MQEEYFGAVKAFFMANFNCGVIGGRPKEAFYLVGIQEGNVILLDPHNTLDTIPLSDEDLRKNHRIFHEESAKKIPFGKLDPTVTFAIYLRNQNDLTNFQSWQQLMKEQFGELWLFSSMERKPAFMKPGNFKVRDAREAAGVQESFEDFQDVSHGEESKEGRQIAATTG